MVVWDFEMSRIDAVLLGHVRPVVAVKFVSPYPILVSASQDGTVCIWGVKGGKYKNEKACLA